ncbi:MAG: hypothetical protein KAW92_11365 [Candidatus Cloacimonetes bacterium]|nr:hypothetical protein [Candidatus Cloacimonadota bacterium]
MEKIKRLKIQGYIFMATGLIYLFLRIFLFIEKSESIFISIFIPKEYFIGWFLIIIGNIWYIGARVAEILVKDKYQKK